MFNLQYVSAKWKNIDPKTKSEYQKRQEELKIQYEIQRAEYEERYGPIQNDKQKRKLRVDSPPYKRAP